MSAKELQEMENPVTRGAKAGEGMPKLANPGAGLGGVEDLGGPTPDNYRPDDDSAKFAEPKVKTVRDVVNRGAKAAEPMQSLSAGDQVEIEDEQEVVAEAPATEEEVVEEAPSIDIEEDLSALFGGEELSEEFQNKARTIFEAVVTAKVTAVQEEMAAQYEATLSEHLEEVKTELVERVDAYLEYVSEEWVTENKIEVEHGLKTEMTESFLQGMKGLFEDHYVHIPEEKYDVLENMVSKLDEMEARLNEQIESNISLNKRLGETTADGIFREVTEGLAVTQKEKLYTLSEGVEFEGEESYREKLVTLKESYFPSDPAKAPAKTETLSEGVEAGGVDVSNSMQNYLKALGTAQ
nr:scaffold prohead core protein [uncultured Mediterranean phage uvMED]|tara:strand:+ start:128 stop:1183 length:1056 start_codon:yes stop_codon:yes gene_type:complete